MPKKQKAPIQLTIPKANPNISRWIVFGLDPSITRTGFSLLDVRPVLASTPEEGLSTEATWLAAGSIKPDKIEDPNLHPRNTLWIRSKIIALYLLEILKTVAPDKQIEKSDLHVCSTPECCLLDIGLIISMEFPTPTNDYLTGLQRIINLIFFEDGQLSKLFGEIRILLTNASTLRSLMGLTAKGNKNKVENILRAYDFIDRTKFPELDSDSCDAVLLSIVARHASSIMLGNTDEVPQNFLNSLCNAAQEIKGKGRNAHTVTRGLLHRIEYWYKYEPANFIIKIKDATNPKKNLSQVNFLI